MSKKSLVIIFVIAILIFGGVYFFVQSIQSEPASTNTDNVIIANGEFCSVGADSAAKVEAAYNLASQSDCSKIGIVKKSCSCNEEDGKCRFDFDLSEKTKTANPDCQPVCLVDTAKKIAEIDWHCPEGFSPKL